MGPRPIIFISSWDQLGNWYTYNNTFKTINLVGGVGGL